MNELYTCDTKLVLHIMGIFKGEDTNDQHVQHLCLRSKKSVFWQ